MTVQQAAERIEECSIAEIMQLHGLFQGDTVIGILSDNGSSYGGNLDSLASKIDGLDISEETEFCLAAGDWDKKIYGKNPPC